MTVTIKIKGIKELNKALGKYIKKIKQPVQFFKDSTIVMQQDVLRHFKNEQGSDRKWKKSKRAIRESGKTLQDKGLMRASISSRSDRTSAATGTNKKSKTGVMYPKIHNEGLGGMPKREFLWLSKNAGKKIMGLMINELNKVR